VAHQQSCQVALEKRNKWHSGEIRSGGLTERHELPMALEAIEGVMQKSEWCEKMKKEFEVEDKFEDEDEDDEEL
jgi:hypothetical protein